MTKYTAIKIIKAFNMLADEIGINPKKLSHLIYIENKKSYEKIVEASDIYEQLSNNGFKINHYGILLNWGGETKVVCEKCLNEIVEQEKFYPIKKRGVDFNNKKINYENI